MRRLAGGGAGGLLAPRTTLMMSAALSAPFCAGAGKKPQCLEWDRRQMDMYGMKEGRNGNE